jgi:hypothetical protein
MTRLSCRSAKTSQLQVFLSDAVTRLSNLSEKLFLYYLLSVWLCTRSYWCVVGDVEISVTQVYILR